MSSNIKTFFLLMLLSALVLFIGQAMGGSTGLAIALVLALVMNVGSYWFSDKIVLRSYNAQELTQAQAPRLHHMVEELSRNAGIPKPRLYLIPDEAPNAFATGRNPENAVVAVTEGIMKLLSPDEIRGVLAHEIAHVANRDILVQSIAGVLATVVMYAANMLQWAAIFGGTRSNEEGGGSNPFVAIALAIVAPIAASMIQFAISRSREFKADAVGAQISNAPEALASALNKLTAYSERIPMHDGNEATAHMFIVNPFHRKLSGLFSTHPPVAERVNRLMHMRNTMR